VNVFRPLEQHRVPLNGFSDHHHSEGFLLGISEGAVIPVP
jgi:catechol-2,3-dioxygenase